MMDSIANNLNGVFVGIAITWVVAALAYALPHPTEADGKPYVIVYRLIHFAGMNLDRMRQGKLPSPQKKTKSLKG